MRWSLAHITQLPRFELLLLLGGALLLGAILYVVVAAQVDPKGARPRARHALKALLVLPLGAALLWLGAALGPPRAAILVAGDSPREDRVTVVHQLRLGRMAQPLLHARASMMEGGALVARRTLGAERAVQIHMFGRHAWIITSPRTALWLELGSLQVLSTLDSLLKAQGQTLDEGAHIEGVFWSWLNVKRGDGKTLVVAPRELEQARPKRNPEGAAEPAPAPPPEPAPTIVPQQGSDTPADLAAEDASPELGALGVGAAADAQAPPDALRSEEGADEAPELGKVLSVMDALRTSDEDEPLAICTLKGFAPIEQGPLELAAAISQHALTTPRALYASALKCEAFETLGLGALVWTGGHDDPALVGFDVEGARLWALDLSGWEGAPHGAAVWRGALVVLSGNLWGASLRWLDPKTGALTRRVVL